MSALDTLDTVQAELDAERRKNDKYVWMNLIQELQREKEEMKEVVELLIKKGKLFPPPEFFNCSAAYPRSNDPSREIQMQFRQVAVC